jgi:ribosomal protein L12E/L44/L45/RPP1/RPP2
LTTAANVELEPIWATLLEKALAGKNIKELLSNVGAGGGAPAAGAAAPAAGAAAAEAPKEEEKKEEEKEESDDDMVCFPSFGYSGTLSDVLGWCRASDCSINFSAFVYMSSCTHISTLQQKYLKHSSALPPPSAIPEPQNLLKLQAIGHVYLRNLIITLPNEIVMSSFLENLM